MSTTKGKAVNKSGPRAGPAIPWLAPLATIALLGIGGASWAASLADDSHTSDSRRTQSAIKSPAPKLTADQAAERAREQTGGHVVSIRQHPDGYWVRMLSARGQVREIWVPSANR
ncbi:hypothetical protein Thiowin_02237 [Thiorhodovibrio winogradskyi]|uniref:PepSY domain-containing protein n=1 Tax=Thiorhodovibrio winogradskyi TaxID=77007 RepID=A0ABZ0S8C3_9GAMM|nr:hypothetical protein [Thiorhodovibrio winogradskyi]